MKKVSPTIYEVFRVEHRKRKFSGHFEGPYSIDLKLWTTNAHCYPRHPCPENDDTLSNIAPRKWQGTYHCGFKSLVSFCRWFNREEMMKLENLGFVLVKYQVKEIIAGKRQVLFIPNGRRKIMNITKDKNFSIYW